MSVTVALHGLDGVAVKHDCCGEVSPSDDIVADICDCAAGDLDTFGTGGSVRDPYDGARRFVRFPEVRPMARTLTLKIDRLTELTPADLASVVGAYDAILSQVICLTDTPTVCDAHRCA